MFVDGLDPKTHEPVRWTATTGEEWGLVNLGNQQNLVRTLCGLSALAGAPQYTEAAKAAIRYAFDHLRDGKLLAWGGHMAYNASSEAVTYAEDKGKVHELYSHYPFYELMWEVDPAETRAVIEHLWNNHIQNWSNLDFNRHGAPKKMGRSGTSATRQSSATFSARSWRYC